MMLDDFERAKRKLRAQRKDDEAAAGERSSYNLFRILFKNSMEDHMMYVLTLAHLMLVEFVVYSDESAHKQYSIALQHQKKHPYSPFYVQHL